jgi:hypothetical protein
MSSPSAKEGHEILVSASDAGFGNETITVKPVRDAKHENKYGQEYDSDSLETQY